MMYNKILKRLKIVFHRNFPERNIYKDTTSGWRNIPKALLMLIAGTIGVVFAIFVWIFALLLKIVLLVITVSVVATVAAVAVYVFLKIIGVELDIDFSRLTN